MPTESLINEQQHCSTTNEMSSVDHFETIRTTDHHNSLCESLTIHSSTSSDITNMLSSLNNDDNNQTSQQPTTTFPSNQASET